MTAETTTAQPDSGHPDASAVDAEHAHPSQGKYVQIALILALITAAEVATYYVDVGWALIPALMVMMAVKFFMVAAWFMHLRFDSRLFRRVFVAGLVLAFSVYIAALAAFEFWSSSGSSSEP